MRAGEGKQREGHTRTNNDVRRQKETKQKQDRTTRPSKNNQKGGVGVAEEDRDGAGCTNHIRITIVQLGGVRCGNWIIILQHSVECENPTQGY